MKKLLYKGIEFDDFVDEVEEYGTYYVHMCDSCYQKHKKSIGNRIDKGSANGYCSVAGCENEAEHYVDFSPEDISFVLDRYFYIIEQSDNGNKVIHMQGNIYSNDDGSYKHAEWTFMLLEVSEAKYMLDTDTFYEFINERVNYLDDITEEVATARVENYFDGEPGKQLDIADITEDTPCGNYWF